MTTATRLARRRIGFGTSVVLALGLVGGGAVAPAHAAGIACPGMMVTLSKADDVNYGFGVDDDVVITLNGFTLLDDNDELATVLPTITFPVQTGDQLHIVASNSTIFGGNAFIESLALFCTTNNNVQILEPIGTNPPNIGPGQVFFDRTYTINFTSLSYTFSGFSQPVDNLPTVNSVAAGRAVPVKFSLGGDQGLDIFEAGYPKSQTISCSSSATVDGIEQTVTAGGSGLTYDASSGQYTYVWKTDKAWAGSCRQLVLKLKDGSTQRANFQFK
jgi:hypothetical protein